MKQSYIGAMAVLHRLCIVISIACLVVMTLVIPWGVFTRYVLGFGSRWPEPMAILLMVIFSFFSAAACYRDNLHISVMALPDALSGNARTALGWAAEIGMIATNLFMVIWGIALVKVTYHQVIAEFPLLSVGLTYLPIPVGGGITLLFVIERLWTGALFAPIGENTVASTSTE
jgi:TRAP-type C4-dicarboxylate transport system permease small subunit